MANEEYLLRIAEFQQEAEKINGQINLVNNQILELESLALSIEKLDEGQEEILASLGKGIFVKSKPLEKELFVNIGCNVVLKKTAKETIEIINRQVLQLENLKTSLEERIESLDMQFQELVKEARKAG